MRPRDARVASRRARRRRAATRSRSLSRVRRAEDERDLVVLGSSPSRRRASRTAFAGSDSCDRERHRVEDTGRSPASLAVVVVRCRDARAPPPSRRRRRCARSRSSRETATHAGADRRTRRTATGPRPANALATTGSTAHADDDHVRSSDHPLCDSGREPHGPCASVRRKIAMPVRSPRLRAGATRRRGRATG